MKIAIRVDASLQIGTGHLMRSLALADRLREGKASVSFICRDLEGNLSHLIESQKFGLHRLPKPKHPNTGGWLEVTLDQELQETEAILSKEKIPVDWLIVDHYALDQKWEKTLRPKAKQIMVIDDLANRPHDCDLLLDQNLHTGGEKRYENLVSPESEKLIGPRYALLRGEFENARKNLRNRDGTIKKILVFFGGVDSSNETLKALKAVVSLNRPEISVDVLVGSSNPHQKRIEDYCAAQPHIQFHIQSDRVAELMLSADLSIGGGGTSTWERLSVGLPTLVISLAPNQEETSKCVANSGAILYLGKAQEVSLDQLKNQLEILLRDPQRVKSMSETAAKIVDGQGTQRVCQKLYERNPNR